MHCNITRFCTQAFTCPRRTSVAHSHLENFIPEWSSSGDSPSQSKLTMVRGAGMSPERVIGFLPTAGVHGRSNASNDGYEPSRW